ncbi:MAG TPA: NADPH:quinone reductase [Candidatus Acidoferrales bacterium]|nr:NADPH:quinone reductase [Candidatus Acidoferrales bacterium]
MKAIRVHEFGSPEVMKLEEIPAPRPGPGQVLVRVKAAGVNPVDTYIRSGKYARLPALPYTPGMDGAGLVESAGEGVKQIAAGDRVYLAGALAGTYGELALCDESQVHRLPAKVTFPQGAALYVPYVTAYRALFQRTRGVAGQTVLIHGGTGGVGIACIQFARAAGMRVIATGGTEAGRELMTEQGAHHVLDHTAPGYLDQIPALTEGRGVDLVLEMLANVNLGKDLKTLAAGGSVAVIGSRGPVEIDARDAMAREASIVGIYLLVATAQENAAAHAAIYAGLESGALRPVVGQSLPLADAPRAHVTVMQPGRMGKIVLVP